MERMEETFNAVFVKSFPITIQFLNNNPVIKNDPF